MSQFHNLKVVEVNQETADTVSIGFEVSADLKSQYNFVAGQYLTLAVDINGVEERRAYSLCSSPNDAILRVGVKKVEGGKVSTYLNEKVNVGDTMKVMVPQGGFTLETNSSASNTYVAFAAGSGITPILSMAKVVSEQEPNSKFHVFYGNKDADNVIFKKQFDALNEKNIEVTYIYSRQDSGSPLTNGRIDEAKATGMVNDKSLQNAKAFFLCGPEEMIVNAKNGIVAAGVSEDKVKFELFTTPVLMASNNAPVVSEDDFVGEAEIKVIYDDEEFDFILATDGDSILDAATDNGVDVPFSCKGAVCCTCKAKVKEGRAVMEANYALSDEEVEEGFVLTCTAHPVTAKVVLDYDDI